MAGLPVYALTGSRRESLNFSFSLFADTASVLIGMDLKVKGEEHLWSHRPAVFVFNHQSKADVVIVAKLLRRDFAGVGKQEIKKETPIIGKVLELGGVVFIDRADGKSAINAMQPLLEAMRKQGKSVVMAPEGTRTVSPTLAPFKKGAFYLAMQAGVPVVPIVIHNAGDVAPKGDFVFRPATVEVTVLPPVDTSEWRAETMDDHVREVRNMFAAVLGQPQEGATGRRATARATAGKAAAPQRAARSGKAPAKKRTAGGKASPGKAQPKHRAQPKPEAARKGRPKSGGGSAARKRTAR
jgi:putative phosphoserine phosphatase/1-acylglycerol-3-phosphate O-acyltransferase